MPVAKKKQKSAARLARENAYRTLVVDAAERVFATQGFAGAKIKDIADAAGLALGTVYALFDGKRDIFAAVHAQRGGLLLERIFVAIEEVDAPLPALARAQRAACEFYAEHPAYLGMHLFSGTSWAAPRLDVDEERLAFEPGIAWLVVLFERAQQRGEIVDERPETCARMYLSMIQVLLAEWHAEGFATPAVDVAARCERNMLRAFARGTSRRSG